MSDTNDLTNETVQLVRQVFNEAKIEQPRATLNVSSAEVMAARRRVNSMFGKSALLLAIIPTAFSLSSKLDSLSSFMFLVFGLTLAVIGAKYIDRATKNDRDLLKAH
jgi:hypothetical protein